jgi:hypothetical protein
MRELFFEKTGVFEGETHLLADFLAAKSVANPVPSTMARVIPEGVPATSLGRPGVADVFVTAADDIAGMNAAQIAERLTIPGSPIGFRIFEFPTPHTGVASRFSELIPASLGAGAPWEVQESS